MKHPLFSLFLGLAAAGTAAASGPIAGSVDYTFASRYVTHGFNVGDTSAHQPSVNLFSDHLPGFSFTYWSSYTVDRDKKASDEHDFMLIYNRTFQEDDTWAVAFSAYADYWFYPNSTAKGGDDLQGMKYHAGASLPNIIPMPEGFNLVPGYNYYFWNSIKDDQFASGGVHEFLLRSDIPLCISDAPAVPKAVSIKGTMNYHTGFLGVDSGFTHATMEIATGAPITDFLSWHASVDYQWTFEDTLNGNKDNIFWATVGLTASF